MPASHVQFVYHKAVIRMRYYSKIWWASFHIPFFTFIVVGKGTCCLCEWIVLVSKMKRWISWKRTWRWTPPVSCFILHMLRCIKHTSHCVCKSPERLPDSLGNKVEFVLRYLGFLTLCQWLLQETLFCHGWWPASKCLVHNSSINSWEMHRALAIYNACTTNPAEWTAISRPQMKRRPCEVWFGPPSKHLRALTPPRERLRPIWWPAPGDMLPVLLAGRRKEINNLAHMFFFFHSLADHPSYPPFSQLNR